MSCEDMRNLAGAIDHLLIKYKEFEYWEREEIIELAKVRALQNINNTLLGIEEELKNL